MTKDASGPAFPSTHHNGWGEPEKGMTLRDYFAAKAMQATYGSPIESTADGKAYIAMHAYKMADAMLKAREQ